MLVQIFILPQFHFFFLNNDIVFVAPFCFGRSVKLIERLETLPKSNQLKMSVFLPIISFIASAANIIMVSFFIAVESILVLSKIIS